MWGCGISSNAVDIFTNLSIFTRCWKAFSSTLFEKSNQTSEYYVECSLSQAKKFLAFSCICIYWHQNLNWMVDHLSIFNLQCKWYLVFLYFSHNFFLFYELIFIPLMKPLFVWRRFFAGRNLSLISCPSCHPFTPIYMYIFTIQDILIPVFSWRSSDLTVRVESYHRQTKLFFKKLIYFKKNNCVYGKDAMPLPSEPHNSTFLCDNFDLLYTQVAIILNAENLK